MVVDPITGGFVGWVCGKLADKGLRYLLQSGEFNREINKAVKKWSKSMRGDKDVDPGVLFGTIGGDGDSEGEHYFAVQEKLLKREWPTKEEWHKAFVERWQYVRGIVEEPQAFFRLEESQASTELKRLAEAVYGVCKENDAIFKSAVIDKLDGLKELIRERKSPYDSTPFGARYATQSGDEESLFNEDVSSYPCCTEEDFHELLSQYSDNLPIGYRQDLFHQIADSAWHIIVDRPYFANKILSDEAIRQSRIGRLIVPLCKAALNNPISSSELEDFFDLLEDDIYFPQDTHSKNNMVLMARILRFLFYDQYHQPDILKSKVFKQQLSRLSDKGEMFWDEFFVDLYLRYSCDYIFINNELLSIIKPSCDRYLREQPNKPLVQLWRLILQPIESSKQYQKDKLFEKISDIARKCQDIIECRWCVSALLRIIPLYYSSQEELDYVDIIKSLIQKFNPSLRSKYPQLQFIYLKALLETFMHTKELRFIKAFEKGFIDSHKTLLLSQRTHLQLEYASCLYVCCQFLDSEAISELHFGQIVIHQTRLLDRLLFRNELLNHRYDLQQINVSSLGNKGPLFRWLWKYILTLYRLYAARLIEENHLRVLQFRSSSRVYHNRLEFGKSVLKSLERYIGSESDYRPSFFAKSTAAFAFVPHNKNIDLIRKYIAKGIQADEYSVLRNARNIAQCLYSCYYYGELSNRAEVEHFADLLAGKTKIGKSLPRLHWAYYAGIKYASRQIERKFLNNLWNESKNMTGKIYQLALQKGEQFEVIFSDSTLALIERYASRGCLCARVLYEELINPEVWNLFGTTVFNNQAERDTASLEKAAHFYAFAKYFVRKRKDYDQKYCYNYIRCKALAYKVAGLRPEGFYIKDTAIYLNRQESLFFAYKKDCAGHYFDVLKIWWDSFPEKGRKFITDVLSQVDWIQKELYQRNLL